MKSHACSLYLGVLLDGAAIFVGNFRVNSVSRYDKRNRRLECAGPVCRRVLEPERGESRCWNQSLGGVPSIRDGFVDSLNAALVGHF